MIPQSFNENNKFLIRIKDNISSHKVRNTVLCKINTCFFQTPNESNVSLLLLNLPIFYFLLTKKKIISKLTGLCILILNTLQNYVSG